LIAVIPMSVSSENSVLILDTHVLVWFCSGSARLSAMAKTALESGHQELAVSAVTAWEYADLHRRGRLPNAVDFGSVMEALSLVVLDLPAAIWPLAVSLPDIHRDPMDRMLVAHAIISGHTLVSADKNVQQYAVSILW
jgi:PIN domain nuclease of toxin-antitoxin system